MNKNKTNDNGKTLLTEYKVGEIVEVLISKPNIGNFPIGIIEDGNVVCLFERTKAFFEIGSIWEVEITEVKPRNLVIKQIRQTKSKNERDKDLDDKMKEFITNGLKSGCTIIETKNKRNKHK